MPGLIRADTAQMYTTAQIFLQSRIALDEYFAQAQQSLNDLQQSQWSGQHRVLMELYWEQFAREFQPITERLEDIAHRLTGTALALDEAARLFGDGSSLIEIGPSRASDSNLAGWLRGSAIISAQIGWYLFNHSREWGVLLKGIRFVRDPSGIYRVFGSRAAKQAVGLSPYLTRFGSAAIGKNMDKYSIFGTAKNIVVGSGPFSQRANSLWQSLRGAPLKPVASFGQRIKGPAIISTLLTTGFNAYDFGWGSQKAQGLLSRKFLTTTTADVSAGLGIVGVSTLIGTAIPIPGVGTAVGFGVGLGLNWAYDTYGKDAWRGIVDQAGQAIQQTGGDGVRNMAAASESFAKEARQVIGTVQHTAQDVGRTVQQKFEQAGRGLSSFAKFAPLPI